MNELQPSTSYEIRVTAENEAGLGMTSNILTMNTNPEGNRRDSYHSRFIRVLFRECSGSCDNSEGDSNGIREYPSRLVSSI